MQLNLFDEISKTIPELKEIESNDWKWNFADYPKEKKNISVFSCFACGGGSTMGYKLAGCDVIGDLEIDKKINEVYVKNHNPRFNYNMDIREFNKLENLPQELYNLDILDGSPPCTTFSVAGDREETWGVKKKFREGQAEQTLDDLSFIFIETVNKLKPKVVIMENVEGLLIGNAFSYVQEIYSRYDAIGYEVKHYLLKGENMGVPQKRHRVFFIAIRKDLNFSVNRLNMAFNYKPIYFKEIRSKEGKKIKGEVTIKRLESLQRGDSDIGDITLRVEGKRSDFNTKIIWDDEIAPTLRAGGYAIRAYDKTMTTDRDYINMQTFPQDYNFGGQSANYICGMSVPPIMIKRIAQRIIETGIFTRRQER